jgi:hypothetical protein
MRRETTVRVAALGARPPMSAPPLRRQWTCGANAGSGHAEPPPQKRREYVNRVLTTHAGSLIRPAELQTFLTARERGQHYDEAAHTECLRRAVDDIVRREIDVGIDVVNDGEMGKSSWITYLYERVSGLEMRRIHVEGSILPPSRDRQAFPGAYHALDALDEAATRGSQASEAEGAADDDGLNGVAWVCTGPITYDRTALDRDIANLKAALEGKDHVDAFLPVVAPASAYWLQNEHYGARRTSCTASPTRCTRSIRRSSTRACSSRSTTPC